ncbi:MerR family DNA-binding transcriptional regulator [Myxococcus xanthus]|nr:MerR family DNA-binding transcriptional regulator [Myxococcus xanthus]
MNIGELALRTGCSARSIRHYEKAGLLASRRRANGYRDFDAESVSRVTQRLGSASGYGALWPRSSQLHPLRPGPPAPGPDDSRGQRLHARQRLHR